MYKELFCSECGFMVEVDENSACIFCGSNAKSDADKELQDYIESYKIMKECY